MGILDAPAIARDANGRRLDSIAVTTDTDTARLAALPLNPASIPPPVLDLNYAQTMALSGLETFTRTATETYSDALGNTQTAASGVAAFDRQTRAGTTFRVPFGMKMTAAIADVNPSKLLGSAYTIAIDIDAGVSAATGPILSLNDGSNTNRVWLGITSDQRASFVVQTGGSVIVNQGFFSLSGAPQTFYGRTRRLVISVANSNFNYSDDGQYQGQVLSGSAPAGSILTHLNIGGSLPDSQYFTGWVKRVRLYNTAMTAAQVLNLAAGDAPVATWGDSLTAGTGAAGPSGYWPDQLRLSRYPHSGVYNGGIGGETSTQIKTRMLADTIRRDWTTVIWAGRNNFTSAATVMADIAAMVANLTHNRFLILSILNAGDGTENSGSTPYNQIIALNQQLAAAYPHNYLDIRSLLVAASGGANDTIAASYRSDGVHLNTTGYTYVAGQVGTFLANKRWA